MNERNKQKPNSAVFCRAIANAPATSLQEGRLNLLCLYLQLLLVCFPRLFKFQVKLWLCLHI